MVRQVYCDTHRACCTEAIDFGTPESNGSEGTLVTESSHLLICILSELTLLSLAADHF